MILPDKPARSDDDDELDFELPLETDDDEEGGPREEESFLPEDDADLGLETDEKSFGLDADTGVDDAMDSEVGADDDDDDSWLGDEEADPSLSSDDDDDADEEEELGEDSEPARGNAEDWDEELPFDEGSAPVGDSGEEGFGEDAASSDNEIDLEQLPPLDGGGAADGDDGDADAVGNELLDEMPLAAGADEAAIEVAPGLRCTRLPAARVALETLLRVERPLPHLIAAGAAGLAWDGALLVAVSDDTAARPERRFVSAGRPFAIAAVHAHGDLFVALATPQGVLCSRDGGRTFAATQAPFAESTVGDTGAWIAASLAWAPSAHGPRLFAAAPAGALWASDDLGATWRRCDDVTGVLKLHASGQQTLVAVCRNDDDGGARALRSRDGGETFDAVALPVREVERVQEVQAVGDVLLCSRRAPTPQLVWRAQSDAWQDLAPFASAPAALLDERDRVCAYFFVQTQERALLLRKALSGAAAPAIVCDFEHEAGTPLQLVASAHDREVTLHIGTERGWYRVRIRPAGEDA